MGMPIIVEIADSSANQETFDEVFSFFEYVDEKFSIYKTASEISMINQSRIHESRYSDDMKEIFALAEQTKQESDGYFNIITPDGKYDPSGIVKGWTIYNASKLLEMEGFRNFYVYAGGDIQTFGKSKIGKQWRVGIQNPFDQKQIVKIAYLQGEGIATSGTYVRGQHIYNPKEKDKPIKEIVGLTVIGPNVYDADRFATAAFAMGRKGIRFIENLSGFEGYMIDKNGIATMTSGFKKYTKEND